MARVRIGSAELDLTLKTAGFKRSVDKVRSDVNSLGDRFTRFSQKVTSAQVLLGSVFASSAVIAAKRIFELGATVEETQDKFDAVFGETSGSVQRAIDQFSSLAGLSKTAAQEVTATTGAIVRGFGFTERAAANLAVEVSQLAADLGAFNNVPVAETARAIQAGLTGEMESLKRLGIAVLDADVKKRALVMTGKRLTSQLTTQEVVTARLELITERAGIQVGNLAATSDSAEAQARELGAELTNLRDNLATAFLPVGEKVVTWANDFLDGLKDIWGFLRERGLKQRLRNALVTGDDAEFKAALDALHEFSEAAKEAANAMGDEFVPEAEEASESVRQFDFSVSDALVTLPRFGSEVRIVVPEVEALADATGRAADEQSRLNSLQSKFSAVSRIAGLVGLTGIGGPLGIAAGAIGAIQGAQSAFSSPPTQTSQSAGGGGEIVLNLNVTDIGGRTTRVIRERIQDLNNRDVPVVL